MSVDFRYQKLGYVALGVTDIERSTAFATDIFGLDLTAELSGQRRLFRGSTAHHDIILAPASEPTFVRGGWQLESEEDLDRAFAHFCGQGLDPTWISNDEAQELKLRRAFRIIEPTTRSCFEYFAEMTHVSSPRRNGLTKFTGGIHYGLVIDDCAATTDYLVKNMGFLISDYMDNGRVTLLRAFPNPNHHSFAPVQFGAPFHGFHHVAYMVETIDDIGRLINRVRKNDIKVQFGVGRHPTSGSIFLYIYDSDFIVWEYTLGMEQFPEIGARRARRMSSRPEDMDLWGAEPDTEYFGKFPTILSEI